MQTPKALLFDIGNVVIDVDFERVARAFAAASGSSWQTLLQKFQPDAAYQAHERGEIGWAEYCDHLRRLLDLELDDRTLAEGWNAVFVGPCEGIEEVLTQLPDSVRRFAFSNTNATHRDYFQVRYHDLLAHFEVVYCSHQLGLRKPDPLAFTQVMAAMRLPAEQILFFDDSPENVRAARGVGMSATQIRSPQDTRDALERTGLLRRTDD